MTDALAAAAEEDQPDWARPMLAHQLEVLGRLADVGLEIALAIERQVKADDAPPERAHIDYSRVARAVRLTLMLQADLIRKLKDYDRGLAFRLATDRKPRVLDRKACIERIVERIATEQADTPESAERLMRETTERLDHDDLYGDVLARPISDLIAAICADLGLKPDWPKLAEQAWAQAEIESGDVGWPLARFKALPPLRGKGSIPPRPSPRSSLI
jgi:hypothetical protein